MPISLQLMSEKEYGSGYSDHLLEQYKLYVEMADRISQRRQLANSFFLAVNTALIALMGVAGPAKLDSIETAWFAIVGIAGVILSFSWYRLIRSYRDLNAAKFRVILAIESHLPIRPYEAEWADVGEGDKPSRYLPFTWIEAKIPWVFAVLFAALIVGSVIA